MPIKRLIALAALASALLLVTPAHATTAHPVRSSFTSIAPVVAQSPWLTMTPWSLQAGPTSNPLVVLRAAANMPAAATVTTDAAGTDADTNAGDLRKALIHLALELRDTRYVRGGRNPATGFDCSGFVRYVFAHAIGIKLPNNSAAQFLAGLKIKRADMKPGDLVFFRTGGKRHISHVGIYISDGRFIHSPATGKTVQVSSLDESYWAKHFAGAKRPSAIALAASNG